MCNRLIKNSLLFQVSKCLMHSIRSYCEFVLIGLNKCRVSCLCEQFKSPIKNCDCLTQVAVLGFKLPLSQNDLIFEESLFLPSQCGFFFLPSQCVFIGDSRLGKGPDIYLVLGNLRLILFQLSCVELLIGLVLLFDLSIAVVLNKNSALKGRRQIIKGIVKSVEISWLLLWMDLCEEQYCSAQIGCFELGKLRLLKKSLLLLTHSPRSECELNEG